MARIESILLGTTDPERLRGWYARTFDVEPDVDGHLDFGSVSLLIIERDDIADATPEPGRTVIDYHVADIDQMARRLEEQGATWVAGVEYRDAGLWFATVEDPDGNHVQLIQGTPTYWIRKRERAGTAAGPLQYARVGVRLPAQDLDRARRWYADALRLIPVEERDGGLRYRCGSTDFVVFASTGKASGDHTQMALTVADLDATMDELRRRGVEFEGDVVDVSGHYPSTGATGERATWFKDSEGNLIGLGEHVY